VRIGAQVVGAFKEKKTTINLSNPSKNLLYAAKTPKNSACFYNN
jgi:hypothetical protein